jgi:23S rRNA (adenine2503-C2)-methyltransferase
MKTQVARTTDMREAAMNVAGMVTPTATQAVSATPGMQAAGLTLCASIGNDELARVFVAETRDGARIEFAESLQPPFPREDKWVLIVSTLKGCPGRCVMCDAGGSYRGPLATGEILAQIDHMIRLRYPDGCVPARKFKVQFARMGDPALNDAVLRVLRELPRHFDAPGLLPSVSTVAPAGRDAFFEELRAIKRTLYPVGRFQLQFSLHTSDEGARRRLVSLRTWSFARMAAFGESFVEAGDRKITLNFAPAVGWPLDPARLRDHFAPERFLIKLTPINPTRAALRARLCALIDPANPARNEEVATRFRSAGYETILSIGELQENVIGSNCGMYAMGESATNG